MRSAERDAFIDKVLSHVKFKFDHEAIREELEEHMEDMLKTSRKKVWTPKKLWHRQCSIWETRMK